MRAGRRMHVILASARPGRLATFAGTLARTTTAQVEIVASWDEVLHRVRTAPPAVLVIDEDLDEADPLDRARELLRVDPWVHVAVVTPLDGAAFHEAAEGLGIVAPIPPEPGADDAESLARTLVGLPGRP